MARVERRLVFCGVTLAEAELLHRTQNLPGRPARSATPALASAHGVEDGGRGEESDHLAQQLASLDALLADPGPRLVLALDVAVDEVEITDEAQGLVQLAGLAWADLTAVFVDDPEATGAAATARAVLADDTVGRDAVGAPDPPPAVAELLEEHRLLWFLPSELDQVRDLHA